MSLDLNLLLQREIFDPNFTLGRLYANSVQFCKTAEDTDRHLENGGEKIYGETAIPRGRYQVKVTWSEHFQRPLPEILDVPGYSGVRFHGGNHPNDPTGATHGQSLGCVLVGKVRTADGVAGCPDVVAALIEMIEAAYERGGSAWVEVK